jgi:hypothetical protein
LRGATYFTAQRGVELELARQLDELKRGSGSTTETEEG